MVKFTHYLVTRFSVPEARWQQDKSGYTTLDQQWFDHRMELFTTYCAPSVRNQTQKNFHWLIYCKSSTDPHDLLRIKESIPDAVQHTIRLADNLDHMLKDLRVYLSECSTPYVITSRLDNDDAIASDFIQTVQSHFIEKEKVLLHLDNGILYDCGQRMATRLNSKGFNTFTSLIERNATASDLITVYAFHHTAIPEYIEVKRISGGIHWLKIIHDRNVRSRLKGIPLFRIPTEPFGIKGPKRLSIRWTNIIGYVVSRWWSRQTS